jgi:SpoVK/Ycf46/Vps4 family AAA+-type ATPase
MLTVYHTGPEGLQAAAAAADELDAARQPGLVTAADFAAAMQHVGPSIVRGAAVEVAPVSWDDVGGYAGVKQRLRQAVEWPLQHAGGVEGAGGASPHVVKESAQALLPQFVTNSSIASYVQRLLVT